MNVPRPALGPFALLVLGAALSLGCGGRVPAVAEAAPSAASGESDAGGTAAASGASADGAAGDLGPISDGGGAVGLGVCTLKVSGAFHAQGTGVPGAGIQTPPGMGLSCQVGAADAAGAVFELGVEQVTGALGPGTYAARGVFSSLSCADYPSGCTWGADDWGYWNVQPGGDGGWNSPLCTLTVQELSSAARAGMRASFDCSAIEPAWYDGPPAPSPIAVSGTFDLPPASAAGAPADAGGDAGVGGEPGHCTVVAEGEYPAAAATGGGGAIGSSEFCDVQAGGIAYAISLDDALAPSVSLVGSTWCASGCSIVYVAGVDGVPDDSECSLEVIEDEGVGGRYVATFACDRLTAGDGTSLRIRGSIDGVHLAEPIPQ